MADNITTYMCRLSRNSGSLNLLKPYGPVQGQLYLYLPVKNLRFLVGYLNHKHPDVH